MKNIDLLFGLEKQGKRMENIDLMFEQSWLEEQGKRMEKDGEENIDLHLERLAIATLSCVR